MANGITYGINFPFRESFVGRYLDASDTSEEEVRSNLVHLLLSKRGTRYFLPDFGSRLYEYIFEPLDGPTFSEIESEIRDSVGKYMPGILITSIKITDASMGDENKGTYINQYGEKEFTVPNIAQLEHTAKIRIDYRNTNNAFNPTDFVIINI
jgi:phage baseplate assembly protein W